MLDCFPRVWLGSKKSTPKTNYKLVSTMHQHLVLKPTISISNLGHGAHFCHVRDSVALANANSSITQTV